MERATGRDVRVDDGTPAGLDMNALLPFALEAGVLFVPGSVFDPVGCSV